MENLIENILVNIKTENDVKTYSMLSLAFLGDAIFSLFVRNKIVSEKNFRVKELHSKTTKFVKAKSQSFIMLNILDKLTEDELQVVKSSRNAKTNNIAKNASVMEYKYATAFESLLGYLSLQKNYDRLNLILNLSYDIINNKD